MIHNFHDLDLRLEPGQIVHTQFVDRLDRTSLARPPVGRHPYGSRIARPKRRALRVIEILHTASVAEDRRDVARIRRPAAVGHARVGRRGKNRGSRAGASKRSLHHIVVHQETACAEPPKRRGRFRLQNIAGKWSELLQRPRLHDFDSGLAVVDSDDPTAADTGRPATVASETLPINHAALPPDDELELSANSQQGELRRRPRGKARGVCQQRDGEDGIPLPQGSRGTHTADLITTTSAPTDDF
mmetsp:Transcript_92096/g.296279  ORF Transcript_92096/g.296279 Transcript_92096/m.296279 type:complete len:244 (+) Transcript_92096:1453-2184(+)